jgi:hypothetical protein
MAKVSKLSEAKALIMMFSLISMRSEHVFIVRKFIAKQSQHVYIKNLNIEAKRSMFILNFEPSEAKRTFSTVIKFISKRSEHVFIKEFKYRSEAKQVNIKP